MKISSFEISNYKGIKKTTIHLNKKNKGSVTTIIGLNESGKSTILEAISRVDNTDPGLISLVGIQSNTNSNIASIPKHLASSFSGKIYTKTTIILDESDIDSIDKFISENLNLKVDSTKIPREFTITFSQIYKDSVPTNKSNLWSIDFWLKKNKGRFAHYTGTDSEGREKKKIWVTIIKHIQSRIPKITYLPSFLFDFPDKIYIGDHEDLKHQYLSSIIQNVLDKHHPGEDLQKHFLDRIEAVKSRTKEGENVHENLTSSPEKTLINAFIRKVSNALTQAVLKNWKEVLNTDKKNQRIDVDWELDYSSNLKPYLIISIVEDEHSYKLSERSLGFRWFFSFLLLIHYTKEQEGTGNIFLLDEPAANLHPKAQLKVLESFSRITNESKSIIYSTHSHYLINPIFLEDSYIAVNKSNFDNEDDLFYEPGKTEIEAIKYKTFVGSHPNKTSYFQPALDALGIPFSPLTAGSKAIITEGKSDFYTMKYFQKSLGKLTDCNIYPADGSGGISNFISIFMAWGVNFLIILDSDEAGKKEKSRYKEIFNLSDNHLITLDEIGKNYNNCALEKLFCDDVLSHIEKNKSDKIKKSDYWNFFYNLLISQNKIAFPETDVIFQKKFSLIEEKLKKQLSLS